MPDPLEGARVGSDEYVLDRGLVNPYVQNWNLTIERQLWGIGSVGSIAYVGNRGLKLTRTSLPNGGPNLRAPFRPDPSRGVVSYLTGGAYSDYDALQASIRARLGRGLSYRLAYTFSRTIDVASTSNAVPTDQSDWNVDRSFADFHQPHILTAFGTYELPFARRHRLLGGWQVGTLVWARSGSPFSLLSNTDNPNGSRINRINDVAGTIDRSPIGSEQFRLARGATPDQDPADARQRGFADPQLRAGPVLFRPPCDVGEGGPGWGNDERPVPGGGLQHPEPGELPPADQQPR